MEKLFESAFVILVVNEIYWKRKFQKNNTRDKEKTIPIFSFRPLSMTVHFSNEQTYPQLRRL